MISNTDDLDRFIQGEIEFEDIEGCICENISIQDAIIDAAGRDSDFSDEEHDLYEKLCYADVLLYTKYIMTLNLTIYMHFIYFRKKYALLHKLDWDCLFAMIIKESRMHYNDIKVGKSIYKDCLNRGGEYRYLFNI